MTRRKQAFLVASEFNLPVSSLKRVLRRINELEIAPDIDGEAIDQLINKLDQGESYYLVDNDIYLLLKNQFFEFRSLVPIENVAKKYDIKPRSLKNYILRELGLPNARRLGFIVSNIFAFSNEILASNKQSNVTDLVNHYFVSLAKKNKLQSAMLTDYSSSTERYRTFSLLESVKMKTSDTGRRSGRIIGFGKDARGEVTPIVATYSNENEIFFTTHVVKLNANQQFDGFKKLDESKPFIEFIVGLDELAGNKYKGLINVFINSLNKKSALIKPINGTKSLMAFSITTNSFKINIYDYQCHKNELKRDQLIKQRNYGKFTRDELVSSLNRWKTGYGKITAATTNPNLVYVDSHMKKQIIWLPDEDVVALNEVSNEAGITVSDYVQMMLNAAQLAMPDKALREIYSNFYFFLEQQIQLNDSKRNQLKEE